ncbi:MAG: UDP-N-acetylglucosamine 1-carboxyvinyltransferase [Lachnospiraceae bacterium]|nr:UDP-N-acetylglucosamine 1-carboxyvinyltransferase [Lachnospiraceae bacterium]
MPYLKIVGGKPLAGEITVQGSKNAALPVLAACLLGDGPCVIENCPQIQDVEDTLFLLKQLGVGVQRDGSCISVDASGLNNCSVCGIQAERIRSSVLFLGALLGRMGKAELPIPGGCAIGRRPVDLHLEAMQRLGAHITEQKDTIRAQTRSLRGSRIRLALPSVGATENAILAAALADGDTVIEHAAREPEVEGLCRFLTLRGADIRRTEDGTVHIRGKKTLAPVRFSLQPDRIVAGTYLLAAASCGGRIRIRNLPFDEMQAPIRVLRQMGMEISSDGHARADIPLRAVAHLATEPYPGFPTDLQSPLMAALSTARGCSRICETVFENRFATVQQLRKMGAKIEIAANCAVIEGVGRLHGEKISAPDLRGGAALAAAALAADGCTLLGGYEYIARGYEDICRDLRSLGADINLTEGMVDL